LAAAVKSPALRIAMDASVVNAVEFIELLAETTSLLNALREYGKKIEESLSQISLRLRSMPSRAAERLIRSLVTRPALVYVLTHARFHAIPDKPRRTSE
jgi:hypothetical protein